MLMFYYSLLFPQVKFSICFLIKYRFLYRIIAFLKGNPNNHYSSLADIKSIPSIDCKLLCKNVRKFIQAPFFVDYLPVTITSLSWLTTLLISMLNITERSLLSIFAIENILEVNIFCDFIRTHVQLEASKKSLQKVNL